MAPSTRKTYERGLNAFKEFRSKFGIPEVWPVPLKDICQFIAYSFEGNMSQATLKCYLAGISFACKFNEFPDPTQKFIVKKLVEGFGRSQYKAPDARLPITYEILVSLIQVLPFVCNSSYETLLFQTSFSVAYHGLLRIGEIAVSNGQMNHIIKIADVSMINNLCKLKVPSSKTDQFGKGWEILLQSNEDRNSCPVVLLNKYMGARPLVPGPLFCHFSGSPLTRYQFVSVLKKSLARVGINFKLYSSHSFRIGRATSLSLNGVPDHLIMEMGRWKSGAYKNYIRP